MNKTKKVATGQTSRELESDQYAAPQATQDADLHRTAAAAMAWPCVPDADDVCMAKKLLMAYGCHERGL
jgi:hypothetical protein